MVIDETYTLQDAYNFAVTRFDVFDCNAILANFLWDGMQRLLEENGYTVEHLDNAKLGCQYLIRRN